VARTSTTVVTVNGHSQTLKDATPEEVSVATRALTAMIRERDESARIETVDILTKYRLGV
jgi:hypothetical protein